MLKIKPHTAALFPGQGSQFIGMGKELFDTFQEAKDTFAAIDDALNQNLSQLMFCGDIEELTLTSNTQPAIMAVSLAVIATLQKQLQIGMSDLCNVAAGHSMGEYSALAASNALSVKDTAKLLRIRGDAMQTAVNPGVGTMIALIGADAASTRQLCESASEKGICEIANDNGAGQIVLSGEMTAIDYAASIAIDFGIKKAIKLKVSAPFHSSLMQAAAVTMNHALNGIPIANPCIDVIANTTAESHKNNTQKLLVDQVTGQVRWRETMEKFKSHYNINIFVEIGPGQVLSGIAKRMYPDCEIFSLHTPKNIEQFSQFVVKNS